MFKDKIDTIKVILDDLLNATSNIDGCVLVTMDGFPVSSVMKSEYDKDLLASMAAALVGVGEQFSEQLLNGNIEQTFIKTSKGYAVMNLVTSEFILIILTDEHIKLGIVFYALQEIIKKLEALVNF
jgi:predicted regulator of Ras-like GTPase activity (Roadblock/LC7/MglB family)